MAIKSGNVNFVFERTINLPLAKFNSNDFTWTFNSIKQTIEHGDPKPGTTYPKRFK